MYVCVGIEGREHGGWFGRAKLIMLGVVRTRMMMFWSSSAAKFNFV